jgi:hypothetical protein
VQIVSSTSRFGVGQLIGISKVGALSTGSAGFTDSSLVSIDTNVGTISRMYHLAHHVSQRSEIEMKTQDSELIYTSAFTVGNGMMTSSHTNKGLVFIGQQTQAGFTDFPLTTLYHIDMAVNGNVTHQDLVFPYGITQWSQILNTFSPDSPAPYLLIGQSADATTSVYTFSVFWLSEDGTISAPIGTSNPDSIYVNYFWADYNACAGDAGQVFVLAGYENTLTELDVRLWTFDIGSGSVTSVLVDNSAYTITSIHVWPQKDCSKLYSLSPGLVQIDASTRVWSLITIDPTTGEITNAIPVTEAGLYTLYYGGGVYGLGSTADGELIHMFQRQNDLSMDLLFVEIATGAVTRSVLLISINLNKFVIHFSPSKDLIEVPFIMFYTNQHKTINWFILQLN